jgi:hypothetical protein
MVMCDRDRAGSIKTATTPPADGVRHRTISCPVTSEPVHTNRLASLGEGADVPSFVDLQHRLRAGRSIGQVAAAHPAHLVCFDLLQDVRGRELIDRPLSTRRRRLEHLLASAPPS